MPNENGTKTLEEILEEGAAVDMDDFALESIRGGNGATTTVEDFTKGRRARRVDVNQPT